MKRPSPALAISIIALFVALGGTSYALSQLPKNSVGTPQLKKNAVTGAKVKDGSLTGADLNVATLGTVPTASSAASANSAQTADRAGSAGTAGSAESAKTADQATTAGSAATAGSATTAGSADTATRAGTAGRADTAGKADTATRADSAGTADSATSAGTAGTATTATTAANALKLNGKTAADLRAEFVAESKLRCPAGMSLAAGVCIADQPSSAAHLNEAFRLCGEENFRLPTEGELIAYVNQYVDSSVTEWIEPEIVAGNELQGLLLTASKVEYSLSTFNPSTNHPYRCVTAASN